MPKYIDAQTHEQIIQLDEQIIQQLEHEREVLESITEINDVPVARINALTDADKDGRIVILPCHVGDIVYDIEDGTPYATRVISFTMFNDGAVACRTVSSFPDVESFGTRIFLTLADAEKALAEMRKEENES